MYVESILGLRNYVFTPIYIYIHMSSDSGGLPAWIGWLLPLKLPS